MKVSLIDICSGIGGFPLGLKQAGFEFEKEYYSEIDKNAERIYKKHFPKSIGLGDITTVDPARFISRRDNNFFITGGFPCQSFSIAGNRGGFEDTRGTIFFDIARIAKYVRPKYMLLENVKGLLSHDEGRTFKTIIRTLDELRIFETIEWFVLNSKNHGVPQNRERVFIFCSRKGSGQQVLLEREGYKRFNESDERRTRSDITPTLTTNCGNGGDYDPNIVDDMPKLKQVIGGSQGARVYDSDGLACTLSSEGGGQGAKTGLYMVGDDSLKIKSATKKGYEVANVGDSINLTAVNSKTRRGRVGKEYAHTLDTQCEQAVVEEIAIRRLTPIECERLQGFPDSWTALDFDNKKMSDSARYKACGNAVTVNVIEYIGRNILKGEK